MAANTVKKSISIPRPLFQKGKSRARREGRNFSQYIAWLIAQDAGKAAA